MVNICPELYPFQSHFADIQGNSMHYLDEGQGETIIMLHGNPSWSFYYRNVITSLKECYRCIAPDHIGCGLSDKPNDQNQSYTLAEHINNLDVLLESIIANGKVTLLLHDWGGAIGLGWASRHPERIKNIILLNTAAFHLPKSTKLPLALKLVRNTNIGRLLVRGLNAFSFGATYLATVKPLSSPIKKAYRAPYNNWQNRIATLRFVQDIPLKPEDPSFSVITQIEDGLKHFQQTPTLICWGEKDFVFNQDFLDTWQNKMPHAKVHTFPNGGHYLLEDQGPAVIEHIKTFLASNHHVANTQ